MVATINTILVSRIQTSQPVNVTKKMVGLDIEKKEIQHTTHIDVLRSTARKKRLPEVNCHGCRWVEYRTMALHFMAAKTDRPNDL